MQRAILLTAVCAVVGGVGGIAAQRAARNTQALMTYTGCVAPGTAAGTFKLTHVMLGDGTSRQQPVPGAALSNAAPPKELMLSSIQVPLAPHRGHKVTVMGAAMRDKANKVMEARMMVASLRMVSAVCP